MERLAEGMRRLADLIGRRPLRLKLTLAFAGLMIVLFGGLALLLYTRMQAGLDAGINGALHARAAALADVVRARERGRRAGRLPLPSAGGEFAQILSANGRV